METRNISNGSHRRLFSKPILYTLAIGIIIVVIVVAGSLQVFQPDPSKSPTATQGNMPSVTPTANPTSPISALVTPTTHPASSSSPQPTTRESTPSPTATLAPTWKVETIADIGGHQGFPSYFTSIDIDNNSNPNIAYYDAQNGDLKYAKLSGSHWTINTVDSIGNVGMSPSLVIDAKGISHIGYFDVGNQTVKYASGDGITWHIETVGSIQGSGFSLSLAIDFNGDPNICFIDSTRGGSNLKHAEWIGSQWVTSQISSSGQICSLAFDATDIPHIAFVDGSSNLKYASWNGNDWTITSPIPNCSARSFLSLVFDSNGNPHIALDALTPVDGLIYISWAGNAWNYQIVDSEWGNGGWCSLAIDSKNQPHIAYLDLDQGYSNIYSGQPAKMRYAELDGLLWNTNIIDAESVGFCSVIALDSNDKPYISYLDGHNYTLKYATLR